MIAVCKKHEIASVRVHKREELSESILDFGVLNISSDSIYLGRFKCLLCRGGYDWLKGIGSSKTAVK
jgi:hypothetical protein